MLNKSLQGERWTPNLLIQQLAQEIFTFFEFGDIWASIKELGLVEGVFIIEADNELDYFFFDMNIDLKCDGKYIDFDEDIVEFELINFSLGLLDFWEVLKFLSNSFAFDFVVEYFTLLYGLVKFKYAFKFHD